MEGLMQIWSTGDAVSRVVATVLLLMSVSAWVLILWKGWVLGRVRRDVGQAIATFWAAPDLATGQAQLSALDREQVLSPLVSAVQQPVATGTLDAGSDAQARVTRHLRDALHRVLAQLQTGQVFLASVGSTSPFIGLFGTVWGIYHALLAISATGSISIDKVAAPVGEALIMTAAGLAVAIPAVLAYNLFGQWVSACEAELEGFAHDLRDMVLPPEARHPGER